MTTEQVQAERKFIILLPCHSKRYAAD